MDDSPLLSREGSHAQRRMRRLFTAAFTAQDVAEPLRSFDIDCSAEDIASILQSHGLPVAALRRDRLCAGYAREAQLVRGCAGDVMRPFASGQLLPGDSPLSAVIEVLSRYDFCFVTALGDVQGVVTRSDIQKPVVRMWLFGIVTLIEMDLGARVRRTWPDGAWVRLLSRARLEKAQALLDERQRRGQRPELLDCLQLTDKASILMQDGAQLAAYGFETKGAAQRVVKEMESLRNHLAHAQDVVTHDWAHIARLARQIEETLALTT